MTLTEFIGAYKGEITFVVNAAVDGEIKIIARIDSDEELSAIKDNILNSEVGKFTVSVSNKIPATASIEVTLKEIAAEATDDSGSTDDGTDSSGGTV